MSIFELINEAIDENGMLPDDLRLPDEPKDTAEWKWAPGALDGVAYYHGMGPNDPEKEFEILTKAIHAASDDDKEQFYELAYEFSDNGIMLHHIDDLQHYIIDNESELNPKKVLFHSYNLMLEAERREAVKLGMAVLELFDTDQEEGFKEPIRILAKHDEFTLNAAFHMSKWKNASQELFEAVKCVKDWGRIHIVRMWEPDTEEMIRWLIINGVKNGVAEYSGLDVYEKVNYIDRLKNDPDTELFRGLSAIMSDLINEGPVSGISAVENKCDLFSEYINAIEKHNDLEADDYSTLLDISEYCDEKNDSDNNYSEIITRIKAIFDSDNFKAMMNQNLKDHKCYHMARLLGYAYQPYAFEDVCSKPIENAWWASKLIEDDYHTEDVYKIMNDAIDLDKLGAAKDCKFISDSPSENAAQFILQALYEKVGNNIPLVKASLQGEESVTRSMALDTIETWMRKSEKTISEISPGLAEYLESLLKSEADTKRLQRITNILNNTIDESDN